MVVHGQSEDSSQRRRKEETSVSSASLEVADQTSALDNCDETVEGLGRVLEVLEVHVESVDGNLFDDGLYAELAEVLGDRRQATSATGIPEERAAEVRLLVERLSQMLIRTGLTPAAFRSAIGCGHPADDLYHKVDLSRCLALLKLLLDVTDDLDANSIEVRRLAVVVVVDAFRAAQGDVPKTKAFWTEPLSADTPSARELVAVLNGGAALLSVARQSSFDETDISGQMTQGLLGLTEDAEKRHSA